MANVFLLLATAQIGLSQGYWTQLDDMPELRYGHTVNELNGKLYLVGGGTIEGNVPPATALVYDTVTGVWSQIPLYNNKVRAAHGSTVLGGKLYVVGGTDGSTALATMEVFDPKTGQWASKTPLPAPRGLAACVALEGKIYVIGGMVSLTDDNGQRTVDVYDTSSGGWTKAADMPTQRWGHSAAVVNGKIYVFGGISVLTGWTPYVSVEIYNPQTNTWTTGAHSMPTGRYCLTTCVLGGDIYTIGGWRLSNLGPIYDKVQVYKPESDTWYTETSMPVARALAASIALGGRICVYGGARTVHPNVGTVEVYEFRKEPGLAYARYARLARVGRDTLGITARIENPLAHTLNVKAVLASGTQAFLDSLQLKDDGLHGDSSAADGLWGGFYGPKKEDTICVAIRTQDMTAGTSRTLRNAATIVFTWAPLITVDTRVIDLGRVSVTSPYRDTSFVVSNIGGAVDSLTVTLDPVNVVPDTAVSVFPTAFVLASGGEQKVTFRIRGGLLSPQYYEAQAIIEAKHAFGPRVFRKTLLFQVVLSSIAGSEEIPSVVTLHQNYPNPFNPTTTITYELPKSCNMRLSVYDMLGREVVLLVNERKNAGSHEVKFDAAGLSSGVYFYRLQVGDCVRTKKLAILR